MTNAETQNNNKKHWRKDSQQTNKQTDKHFFFCFERRASTSHRLEEATKRVVWPLSKTEFEERMEASESFFSIEQLLLLASGSKRRNTYRRTRRLERRRNRQKKKKVWRNEKQRTDKHSTGVKPRLERRFGTVRGGGERCPPRTFRCGWMPL